MTVGKGYDTYRTAHYEGMNPERLILMLYDGAIKYIRRARQGIDENNIQMRGENLSRTIAIVSELNASLDPNINDEAIGFLRGLYAAILAELPKVSINNDTKILDRSEAYISQLKEIWEKDVMKKQHLAETRKKMSSAGSQGEAGGTSLKAGGTAPEYPDYAPRTGTSISV